MKNEIKDYMVIKDVNCWKIYAECTIFYQKKKCALIGEIKTHSDGKSRYLKGFGSMSLCKRAMKEIIQIMDEYDNSKKKKKK